MDLATTKPISGKVISGVRRVGLVIVLFTTVVACSLNMPGASNWARKHDIYPNVTGEQAAEACRNQSATAFRNTGGKAEALYAACMEAFGFAPRPAEDITASSAP